MMPTDTELSYFLELFATQHFSKSALRLGVTQPTLTQSIFRLEEKLGGALFIRTKTGCHPTELGKSFYGKAHKLKDYWSEVQSGLNNEGDLQGKFKLGIHPSLGAYVLPQLFKELHKSAPGIAIELHHESSRVTTEKVVSYELDFAFVVNPARHKDLVIKKLATDRNLMWKSSQIKKVPPLLFTDWEPNELKQLLGKKTVERLQDYAIVQTSSLELIRTLVVQGAGLGFLPERVALAENAKLVCFDEALTSVHDDIALIYRFDTLKSRAGVAVLNAARTVLN